LEVLIYQCEIDEAVSIIAKSVDHDADIIFGAVIDEKMLDQIKITLIATKFNENKLRAFNFKRDEEKIEIKDNEPIEFNKEEVEEKNLDEQEDELLENDIDEEDSEFDIPSFLRKK